jgi:hypothetical protein
VQDLDKYMKTIALLLFFLSFGAASFGQGALPPSFYAGKSVVLVSTDPAAQPSMSWQQLSDNIHTYLAAAGADPVAYYELEQVTLSAEKQAEYAKAFQQREIKNIIFVTRQKDKVSVHVGAFSGDGKLIGSAAIFGLSGQDWKGVGQQLAALGKASPSKNLLVPDLAEFPPLGTQEATATAQKFISRNPLNLEVFRLGIPLEGTSAVTGATSSFRYDLFGKSAETLLAEQLAQKTALEDIFSGQYPHEVAWLTEAKSTPQLLADRIQFVLVKVEGRQADLMKSMGLEPATGAEGSKMVVKYYIRFLVREELYLGPTWDAHPDWRIALKQFLDNLKK